MFASHVVVVVVVVVVAGVFSKAFLSFPPILMFHILFSFPCVCFSFFLQYRSGEKFETAQIDKFDAQYTYNEGETFFFMNSETFEEIPVGSKVVGDREKWLSEGSEATLVQFKDQIIEVMVPSPAIYEVVETEPNVKGNTAQGYTKPATLDCGAVISVPGFVEQGSKVRVDTEKGEYMDRV